MARRPGVGRFRIRTLHIGATEFRWTAELHDPLPVRLRVWGGGKNGCMLRADLTSSGDAGLLWGDAPDIEYPTPRVVRAIIEYALDRGWDPASVGGRHDIESGAEPENLAILTADGTSPTHAIRHALEIASHH